MSRNRYLALLRREFWEYRSLWIWPLAVTGLLLVLTVAVATMAGGHVEIRMGGDAGGPDMRPLPGPGPGLPFGMTRAEAGVFGLASQILGVAGIVALIYLLDCLYAERKDRSILFWKSLPVSDAATVLSKAAVGLVITPLFAYLLALVAFPLIHGIGALGPPAFVNVATGGWNTLDWLRAEGWLLLSLLVSILWYAPLAGWAMLASVLARRTPVAVAALPPVAVALCESILLQSGHVWRFLGARLSPVLDPAEGIGRPSLWLGLAVAAGMLYAAIRLRRYRDDT